MPIFKRLRLITIVLLSSLFSFNAVGGDKDQASILVFGGTGKLGSDVVKALHAEGHKMTVFARETSNRKRLDGVDVSYVIGDVLDGPSIESAVEGKQFDVFIDALGRGSAGVDFFRDSATNIAATAKKAGVKQIILHGSVGAGNSASVYDNAPESMQKLFVAKGKGEQAVMDSGIQYTIIRNGHLIAYGTPETGNAELYEEPLVTGSVTRLGLARLTATCIMQEKCENKIFHAIDKTL